jgi:hypothetical protein
MWKLIALAAVLGAVLIPATAYSATATKLSGVAVSKQTARHTFVVASPHGVLTTVRATAGQLRSTPLGARISVNGTQLADGSFHATGVRRSGMAKLAHIRATVLKVNGATLLVAGGGSAFALRLNRAAIRTNAAARSGPKTGDEIETDVHISHGRLVGGTVTTTGTSVLIDFSGKVTAMDSTSLTVTDDGVSTVVAIPVGVTLPQLVQIGSEVEIVASVSGATLTLVEIKIDEDGAESGDDGGSNVDGESGVHVEGFVTFLDAGSITIQPGENASPVTFAIPPGFTVPAGLAAGSRVEARGAVVGTVLTLTRLELNTSGSESGDTETEGTVTALDSGSIRIQPAENGTPLTFAIPVGFALPAGLQVGSSVEAKGAFVASVLTLSEIELKSGGEGGVDD